MSAGLTQLLEILQAHGLMERSDETFLSARDLVQLDDYLAQYDTRRAGPYDTVDDMRCRIRYLEDRIYEALQVLESY